MKHINGSERPRGSTAYFDVDHTLTRISSLESFIGFFAATPRGARVAGRIPGLLRLASRSTDLDQIHDAYAAAFQGESWNHLMEVGEAWYASVRRNLFQDPALRALRMHQACGDRVVFVSGSWAPCLAPIARDLGVDTILQSQPTLSSDGDTFEGAFDVILVGARKVVAIRADSARCAVTLSDAFAYSDHRTDEAFLAEVGNPIVVGDDAHLRALAEERGWKRLPSA